MVDVKEKTELSEVTGLGGPKGPQSFQRKDNSGNWPGILLCHHFSVSLLNYCWTLNNALASCSLRILYNSLGWMAYHLPSENCVSTMNPWLYDMKQLY